MLTTGQTIADNDQIIVERIKKEDGIILGKTSCPGLDIVDQMRLN